VSGSFKARGMFNRLLANAIPPSGVIAASGGNAGIASAVAARALGACGTSTPTIVRFATPKQKFLQLSGCFIASAAFDDETVDTLRRLRDRATRASGLAAAGAELYYRSSPPLAALIRKSETARALVRKTLGPLVTLARVAETTSF